MLSAVQGAAGWFPIVFILSEYWALKSYLKSVLSTRVQCEGQSFLGAVYSVTTNGLDSN